MISRETINDLTEEELGLVLHLLNTFYSCKPEITPTLLASYKFKFLAKYLQESKNKIKEEYWPIYYSVCEKLKVPLLQEAA